MIQRGTHLCISTQFLFTSKHFQERAVSTEIEQKAFIQLPRDVCCSLSRNFLRAHTFHRDTQRYHFPPRHFWEPTLNTEIEQEAFILLPIAICLHFIKESFNNPLFPPKWIEISLSTDAFFVSPQFPQILNRMHSPNFPWTIVEI